METTTSFGEVMLPLSYTVLNTRADHGDDARADEYITSYICSVPNLARATVFVTDMSMGDAKRVQHEMCAGVAVIEVTLNLPHQTASTGLWLKRAHATPQSPALGVAILRRSTAIDPPYLEHRFVDEGTWGVTVDIVRASVTVSKPPLQDGTDVGERFFEEDVDKYMPLYKCASNPKFIADVQDGVFAKYGLQPRQRLVFLGNAKTLERLKIEAQEKQQITMGKDVKCLKPKDAGKAAERAKQGLNQQPGAFFIKDRNTRDGWMIEELPGAPTSKSIFMRFEVEEESVRVVMMYRVCKQISAMDLVCRLAKDVPHYEGSARTISKKLQKMYPVEFNEIKARQKNPVDHIVHGGSLKRVADVVSTKPTRYRLRCV